MLKIRLARVGKRKKPTYRLIVSETGRDTYGRVLEILGHYNPFSKVTVVNKDRILYWISKGAKVSPTLNNLLVDQNVLTGQKIKVTRGKKKPEVAAPKPAEKKPDQPAKPAAAAETPKPEVAPVKAEEAKPEPETVKEEKPAEEKKAETKAE
ncbi:MAG: 30S ribosomal protein S16 [Candidatus Buchananbacteria bacterium RIFCSPLOWO2_01_FULL_46_12]|uniref:Small ribosomal subunit protein bS16 n=2 Tax=Candidatus Buchananiibacteriota TaxID=1817903 RepID=A0A1G1YTV0_9BACT|nr:MAG: 30S ribosomal protein S16 [Candidatus Buchananbacteria bacterium RIFCSPHIGHO2_01_FULL_44_11]OGY55774.1 MAG: 30S ribosomal protein S16 [Candidatus Buchananbacteria bacterium RIFCSPLOWO2_01_FULL_46_12]